MTCIHHDNLTVCRPSSWKVFSRKHLPHDWIVEGEDGESYCDPSARFDYSRCHRDRTTFPTCSRKALR